MLSRTISKKIAEALSEFCDVSEDQFGVSFLSGKGHLDDLVLKPEALQQFDLPIEIVSASCHSVKFGIPWARLASRPCEVVVEEVVVLARNMSHDFTPEEMEAKITRAKEKLVNGFEAKRKQQMEAGKSKGFVSRLTEMIIHNIMVEVKKVHIRFEATTRDVSVGVVVSDLKVTTTDSLGKEKFVDPASIWQLHKRLSFKGLTVYAEEPEDQHFVADMSVSLRDIDTSKSNNVILGPIDGVLDAAMVFKERILEKKDVAPFLWLKVQITDVVASLSREQYISILRLASLVMKDVNDAPKASDQPPRPDLHGEYQELFKKELFKETMSDDEKRRWAVVQHDMNGPEIVEVRSKTYESLNDEIAARREKAKNEGAEPEKQGWWKWGGGATEDEKVYAELEKEYGVDNNNEADPDTEGLPPSYVWQDLTVSVGSLGVRLRYPERWPLPLQAQIKNLGANVMKRNSEGSIDFGLAIVDMDVSNPTATSSWLPSIVSRTADASSKQAGNLVDLWGSMKPVKQPIPECQVDGSMHLTTKGLLVVADMKLVSDLMNFFAIPEDIEFPGLAEATATAAQNARASAADQLSSAMDAGTVLDIQIKATAPTILLPRALADCRRDEPAVVISLGTVRYRTLPITETEKKRRIEAARDGIDADEQMILYYPHEAALEEVSVALLRTEDALQLTSEAHYLLPPFGAKTKLYTRIMATQRYPDLPIAMVHALVQEVGVTVSLHDAFVLRYLMDAWTDQAKLFAQPDTARPPVQPQVTAAPRSAAASEKQPVQPIRVQAELQRLYCSIMADDFKHIDELHRLHRERSESKDEDRFVVVGQRRSSRTTLECVNTDFGLQIQANGDQSVKLRVGGVGIVDDRAKRAVLHHSQVHISITPGHVDVSLPDGVKCSVGTALVELTETMMDVKNMLMAPTTPPPAATPNAAAPAQDPTLSNKIASKIRIALGPSEITLMKPQQNGSGDADFMAISIGRVGLKINAMQDTSMRLTVDVATAIVTNCDSHLAFSRMVAPAAEAAELSKSTTADSPNSEKAVSTSAKPLAHIEFRTVANPTFVLVEQTESGAAVANLQKLDWGSFLSVEVNPVAVTVDTTGMLAFVDYMTVGLFARFSLLGLRKRYDGKEIIRLMQATQQVMKMDIVVHRPEMVIPEDPRDLNSQKLHMGVGKLSITNEIRRTGRGCVTMRIAIDDFVISHDVKDAIEYTIPRPLNITMEQPIIANSMPGDVKVTCDDLGQMRLADIGVVHLLNLVVHNVLPGVKPPPSGGRAAATAAQPYADAPATAAPTGLLSVPATGPQVGVNVSVMMKSFGIEFTRKKSPTRSGVSRVFRILLSEMEYNMTSMTQRFAMSSIAGFDKKDVEFFRIESATCRIAKEGTDTAIDAAVQLPKFLLCESWVDVVEFACNDVTTAALKPILDMNASAEPAPTQAAAAPTGLKLRVKMPTINVALMQHAANILSLEIRDVQVAFSQHPDGMFETDSVVRAIRIRDVTRGYVVLQDGAGSEFVRITGQPGEDGHQHIDAKLGRFFAALWMPTINDVLPMVTGEQSMVTRISAALAPQKLPATSKPQPQPAKPTEKERREKLPASPLLIGFEWEPAYVYLPSDCDRVDGVLKSLQSSKSGMPSGETSGIALTWSAIRADVTIDARAKTQHVSATVTSVVSPGLLADLSLRAEVDVANGRTTIDVKTQRIVIDVSPQPMQMVCSTLYNNVLVAPPQTAAVPPKKRFGKVKAATLENVPDFSVSDDETKPMQIAVKATSDGITMRFLTAENWIFASYRINTITAESDMSTASVTVESVVGRCENGREREENAAIRRFDPTLREFFKCGGSKGSSAIQVKLSESFRNIRVDVDTLDGAVIPEVFGRVVDLALVFVTESAKNQKPQTPKTNAQPAAPASFHIDLNRANIAFVTLDGSDVATLHVDGVVVSQHVDTEGLSVMTVRVASIMMKDQLNTHTNFPKVLESRQTSDHDSHEWSAAQDRSSSTSVDSCAEVVIRSLAPSSQKPLKLPHVEKSASPRFTTECVVSVSAFDVHYIPNVFVELQSAAARAAAVMSNLTKAQASMTEARKTQATSATDFSRLAVHVNPATIYLVKDVADAKTVGLSPGKVSVQSALEVHGERAYQVMHIRLDDLAIKSLDQTILKQTEACSAAIFTDITPRECDVMFPFREPGDEVTAPVKISLSASEMPSRPVGDQRYTVIVEANLPMLKADVSEAQFGFLLGFGGAMLAARTRPGDNSEVVSDRTQIRAQDASERSKRDAPPTDGEIVAEERAKHHDAVKELVAEPEPLVLVPDVGIRTAIDVKWDVSEFSLADTFALRVEKGSVSCVMALDSQVINVCADGASLRHLNCDLLKSADIRAAIAVDQSVVVKAAAEETELLRKTKVDADLGSVSVCVSPACISDAHRFVLTPMMRSLLGQSEPGPILKLEDEHEVKLEATLKPTANTFILVSNAKQLCTYVLDLNNRTLDLSDARSAAPLIVLTENTRLRLKNGTIRLPGCFSLRSFVKFGFNSSIDYDADDVVLQRLSLNHGTENNSAWNSTMETLNKYAGAHGPSPVQELMVHAKLQLNFGLRDDTSDNDALGIAFTADVNMEQRAGWDGAVESRSITTKLTNFVDTQEDLLQPCDMTIKVSGVANVNVVANCPHLTAMIRFQRGRKLLLLSQKFQETLPLPVTAQYPGTVLEALEDRRGRPLTRRAAKRDCSICGDKKCASLGAGRADIVTGTSSETRVKEDEADTWICQMCATGVKSTDRFTCKADIQTVDATVVGKQGEMVQLSLTNAGFAMDDGVMRAEVEASVWASNPYCGQWEALVERLKATAKIDMGKSKYVVDVPFVELNVTGDMLRSAQRMQEDAMEILSGNSLKEDAFEATAEVVNWTDAEITTGGKKIGVHCRQTFKDHRGLLQLTTGQDRDLTRTYLSLDRTTVVAAKPHIVDIHKRSDGKVSVDVIPVHSSEGIVKVISKVPDKMFLLGCGAVESCGTTYLGEEVSIDNALVLRPAVEGIDYQLSVPTNTSIPTIRRLLNGEEFKYCTRNVAASDDAKYYRVHAANVGMSLGVPRFEITITGGFTVENRLPLPITLAWVGADNKTMNESKVMSNADYQATLADSAIGKVKMSFAITQTGLRYQCEAAYLEEGEQRIVLQHFDDDDTDRKHAKKELAILVEVSEARVLISAPFYLVNHAIIPLTMEIVKDDKPDKRNWHTLPAAESHAVICTPDKKPTKDKEPELMVRLGFQNYRSKDVPLHVTAQTGQVSLENPAGDTIHLTYSTVFTDDSYASRTVIITPRWVIVNRTRHDLYFAQDLEKETTFNLNLKPGTALGYYSMRKPPGEYGFKLVVGRTARQGAGTGLSMEEMGSVHVVVCDPEDKEALDVVNLTVRLQGAITYITADPVNVPGHFFINRTDKDIDLRDIELEDHPQRIPAYSGTGFVFSEQRKAAEAVKLRFDGVELFVALDEEMQVRNDHHLVYRLRRGINGQMLVTLLPASEAVVAGSGHTFTAVVHNDLSIEAHAKYVTVSLANNAVEIANATVQGIMCSFNRKKSRESVRATIMGLQVDNHTEQKPLHPVVAFALRKKETTPAIDFKMERIVTGAAGYIHIPELKLDVQPIVAKVADLFLVRMLELVKIVTGTNFGQSKSFTIEAGKPLFWPSRDDAKLFEAAPKPEGALATTLEIDELIINPIFLRVWFTRERGHDVLAEQLGPAISRLAISLDDVVVTAEGYVSSQIKGSIDLVSKQLQQYYLSQIKSQIFGLVFQYMSAIPLVGAPIKYAGSIGKGVAKFFTDPIEGLTESPQAFAQGLAKGTTQLVGSIFGGGLSAVSSVAGSGARLANIASGDKNQTHHGKVPGVVGGVVSGVTGLVTKPVQGAKDGGAKGFAKGLAHGVAGVAAAPVAGLLSDVSRVTNKAASALQTETLPDVKRTRNPRSFGHTGALVPLNTIVEIYEYQRRKSRDSWSTKMAPSDGPKCTFEGKAAKREEVEKRFDAKRESWKLDRFHTNFDGWIYSKTYDGNFTSQAGKKTQFRRRRWVLEVKSVEPRNAQSFATLAPTEEQKVPLDSSASSSDDEKAADAQCKVKVYEIYENQRYFPGSGWGKHLLPSDRGVWTDVKGHAQQAKGEIMLPSGWAWINDWIVATEDADEAGWEYALDFPREFSSKHGPTKVVRRRAWRRVAQHATIA
jgi:hypothetical protein